MSSDVFSSPLAEEIYSITKTVQAYHDDVKSSGTHHHQTFLELKEELKTLSSSIATEKASAKQIKDYEAKKADIEAKLLAADKALEKERQKVAIAGERESTLSTQIFSLESEAAALRSRTEESSATADRLAEISMQNKALQERLDTLKDATSRSSEELQHKFQEHANMQLQKDDLESQLKGEREKATSMANERLELERSATTKLESCRVEQVQKAKWETNILVAEHRLAMQKLEEELAAANSKKDRLAESNHDLGVTFMEQVRLTAEMRTARDVAEKCEMERLTELQEAKAAWNTEVGSVSSNQLSRSLTPT